MYIKSTFFRNSETDFFEGFFSVDFSHVCFSQKLLLWMAGHCRTIIDLRTSDVRTSDLRVPNKFDLSMMRTEPNTTKYNRTPNEF